MALAGQKTLCLLARPENNVKSEQTCFSYSLDKGLHPPEF